MQARPKGIDLFAGPGGLSFGLTKAGFDIVAAVEWDKAASRTYRHNIGDHVHQIDVTEFPPAMMEKVLIDSNIITSRNEIALISGGPPCPAFSMMGRSKISNLIKTGKWEGSDSRHAFIDDPRVRLFTNFVDYVRYFTPELFLMENVSGMNSFKQERAGVVKPIIEVIRTEFDRIGYAVKHRTVNASSYGVPQNRKRVIFLGWKKGAKEPEYP
ncbi:MAG: DNA (cytosine-5-)-methyltransferase, partial [Candidatus Thermoplasmatota archaeon]|nr:DNA (cytosine-5-)-methyltransferase [Candidatus Thermoplasmatota archaeon]